MNTWKKLMNIKKIATNITNQGLMNNQIKKNLLIKS